MSKEIKVEAATVKVDANTGLIVEEKMSTAEIVEKVKLYVDAKEKKVFFNGKRYPEIDDWEYIGTFYGLKCKTFDPLFVEIDGRKGFKAKAALYDDKQNEVGRAESYCMNDEPNWMRKPLFQLASMAQTRAGAKAYSNLFRPIARMCAMETTPFEELEGTDATPNHRKDEADKRLKDAAARFIAPPTPSLINSTPLYPNGPTPDQIDAAEEFLSDEVVAAAIPDHQMKADIPFTEPPPGAEVKKINKKQQSLLFFRANKANIPANVMKAYLKEHYGVDHSADLPWQAMDPTLKWIDKYIGLKTGN